MGPRAKAIAPLALVIGVISFLWTEFSLNFTFHWVSNNLPAAAGVDQPKNFHLILPAAFITYGLFFAAGGDNAAFGELLASDRPGPAPAILRTWRRGAKSTSTWPAERALL